jgi:hypothetical protein
VVPEPYSNTQIMGMEEQALLVHTHTYTPTHTREEAIGNSKAYAPTGIPLHVRGWRLYQLTTIVMVTE